MTDKPQPTAAVKVFFSYAHEDAVLCERLRQQFSFLRREKIIADWYDGEIKPGEEWRGEIEEHLNEADVILLLISAAFAHSDFCYNIETGRALERHDAGEAVVVPIILHPCEWRRATFAKLQALPGGDEAISELKNIEKALYEVARGVRVVVEDLIATRTTVLPQPARADESAAQPAHVPPPPAIDFVRRKDRDGGDMVERLKRELTREPKRLILLWGVGGVGKTTIAAETVRELEGVYGERIVWASAEKRADFTYPTLLNEIATRLGEAEITKLATGPKEQAVGRLLAAAPSLVVLDNFESVAPDDRQPCADFLATRARCHTLITTRERVAHDAARHLHVASMDDEEAHKFVARWIAQEAHDPRAFEGLDFDRIIRAADARPYVLQWVLARIELALEPRAALDELARAEGEVGERVFKRSFELPQLGDDGRDALLALSLFTPSATREALAEVAGFGDDGNRLNEAVKRLAALRLVETTPGGQRLTIEGLTRSLAHSHLSNDERADNFRRRYVAYFLRYAEAHEQPSPEDFDALEAEKDNLLSATDAANALEAWESVVRMAYVLAHPADGMLSVRGYWDEALRVGDLALKAARSAQVEEDIAGMTHNVAVMYQRRGEPDEARRLYGESLEINKRLGNQSGIASTLHQMAMLAQDAGEVDEARRLYGESLEINKRLGNQSGIAYTLGQLGNIAYEEGELTEARQLYGECLEISKKLGDQSSIAIALHQMAMLAQDSGELDEARRLYGESLEINKRLGNQSGIALALHQLGRLAQDSGERDEARRLYGESLEIEKRLGDQRGIAITLHELGRLAQDSGERDEARRLYGESLEIKQRLGDQSGIASTLHQLGRLAQDSGERDEARRLYGESLEITKRLGNQSGIASTTSQLGIVHYDLGEFAESKAKHEESLAIRRKIGDQQGIAVDLYWLAMLAELKGNKVEAARLFREALSIFEKLHSPYTDVARQSLERVEGEAD